MNDYVERLCPVGMPESWTWVSLLVQIKAGAEELRIREALGTAPRSLVRFAPDKGKLDCRLIHLSEQKRRKLTEADVKRAERLLLDAEPQPPITAGQILVALIENGYYRLPARGNGK